MSSPPTDAIGALDRSLRSSLQQWSARLDRALRGREAPLGRRGGEAFLALERIARLGAPAVDTAPDREAAAPRRRTPLAELAPRRPPWRDSAERGGGETARFLSPRQLASAIQAGLRGERPAQRDDTQLQRDQTDSLRKIDQNTQVLARLEALLTYS